MNQKWEDFKNKYLQNKVVLNKKIFLKENCGDSAAPMSVSSPLPVPAAPVPLEGMSPEQAFDAGYSAAVSEIMEVVGQMMSGEIPVEMDAPEDIANLDQLEEGD